MFTTWYRALRTVLTGQPRPDVEAAYESALATLAGCGMPGVSRGLAPLTRLCLRLRYDEPLSELPEPTSGRTPRTYGPCWPATTEGPTPPPRQACCGRRPLPRRTT